MSEQSNNNTPSDFHDIRQRITYGFSMHGIDGVEKVVNDLAAEANAAEVLAQAVDDLESEKLTVRLPLGEFEKVYDIAFLLDDTQYDHELAQKRLAFARDLFEIAKKECGQPE